MAVLTVAKVTVPQNPLKPKMPRAPHGFGHCAESLLYVKADHDLKPITTLSTACGKRRREAPRNTRLISADAPPGFGAPYRA
jgi:hypothetical protein